MPLSKKQKRDLQKYNYQLLRAANVPAKVARKYRNRSIETAYQYLLDMRRQKREAGKIFPFDKPIPKSLKTIANYKARLTFISKNLNISRKDATKFQNLSIENWIKFKNRITGFKETVIDRTGLPWNKILKTIKKKLGDHYSMADLWKAFRVWYNANIGVTAE